MPEYAEIARAETERGEVVLRARRDGDQGHPVLELRVNGIFVMDSLETSSERALAEHALALVDRPAAVLVGGLGLGFTAHAVLADSRVERLTVVEIEEALVGWMRDGTAPHGPALLADERLSIVVADIVGALAEGKDASYDLVLLDVDNGPAYLVYDANAAVYRAPSLTQARRILRPGGVLAIWSADRSPELEAELATVFGNAEALAYDVPLHGRAEQYWLHVSRQP
ncbi:spermidine synthase [Nocardioides speluncae]|uniref:spermidine synthase n=1 Tax=Nocardioides speluncae TaxID=2670337 RepID=UPI000D68690E|nr:hypothetical protein [Nocardioides speluncae]